MEADMRGGPLEPDKNPLFSRPETIPERYWQSLTDNIYNIEFLGFKCSVQKEYKNIVIKNFPIKPDFQTYLVILNYLIAKKIEVSSDWVLAKELKGGIHFFDRSHPLTVKSVLEKVKCKEDLFNAFKVLKGKTLNFGDLAYELELFPEISLRYIFYEGDDEFESNLTVNFQKGIEDMLALDVIWAMVNVVNKVLLALLES